jgi:hypothetical protein
MSASVAVRGWLRIPLAGPAFRHTEVREDATPECCSDARVESVRKILAQGGHNVAGLSLASRQRYGTGSPYFIPPTFLYKLSSGITPHLCQIVALSEITGYRFLDWMRVCGFDFDQIPRLQVQLHRERTVLITPIEFETSFWPESSANDESLPGPSICPRLGTVAPSGSGRYLFAKIGGRDAVVCPKLIPGSVVRVDRSYPHGRRVGDHRAMPDSLWLVEHPGGLRCCQVRWIDDEQIVLLPRRPPCEGWPLRLPKEARILGLVDVEPGSAKQAKIEASCRQMKGERSSPLPCGKSRRSFSDLLRLSRARTGLTFREAHRLTNTIAQMLGNREYAIALGLLSDYEAMSRLPRHIAKIISLCSTYCMDVRELMEVAGVNIDDSTKIPLPTRDHAVAFRSDSLASAERQREVSTLGSNRPSAGRPFEKVLRYTASPGSIFPRSTSYRVKS